MPYDALGNYIPGDEEPSLEEMRLSLEKSQRPSTDIKRSVADVLMRYNPVMMQKSLQDVPRAAYNMSVAPLLSTWAGTLGNVQAEGAAKIYEALGKPEEAARVRRKIEPVSPANFQAPLQTPEGEAFQEGTGKAMEAAKVPHMWPVGVPNPNARPMLTPNDVRVMGAEATRVGRQVRDIPMDFSNAQSGFTRIDPVTGKPTMGARLQGAAEDIGRIVEQRRAAGESTIPGVPEVFTPETRAYAVRPAGTTLTMPQNLPKGMEAGELPEANAVLRTIENTIGPIGVKMTPDDAAGQIAYMSDHTPGVDQRAFGKFQKRKAMELYPDAPTSEAAFQALVTATPPDDRKALTLKHYDEFRQTPEGVAAGFNQLPSSTELMQRDEAAREWLQGPFTNYFKKHLGAVNDPLVKLASTGITYTPKSGIEPLDVDLERKTVVERRKAAGLPVEGTVAPALHAAQAKLSEAEAKVNELNTQRERYRDIAMQQGLQDPAQLPEFAKLTNPLNTAIAARDKIQEQVQNLELGKLYEDRADMAVKPRTPESILKGMDYRVKQFYPSVTRAQPGETLYTTQNYSALRELGYDQFVTEFYNKVLEGEIPVDKLKDLTVEKAVRQLAEPRIAKEKAEAKAALTFKTDAETVMKNTMQTYAKPENYFGNVGAVELTKDMNLDVPTLTRILSEDTTVLDHCIAQGGSSGKPNPWFPGSSKNYEAIYNVVTGQKNPNAGRDTSSYVNSILAGDMMTSFRDANTGTPVATFQFHRSHLGQDGRQKYSIGYASGHRNGEVNAKYIDGIKDYLNAHENDIAGVGGNLSENLGIYDIKDLSAIRNDLRLKRDDMGLVDWQSMPRFVTDKEIKATIQATKDMQDDMQAPAVARPEPGGPLQADTPLPQALRDDIVSAYENAVENVETAGDRLELQTAASRGLERVLDHFMNTHLDDRAQRVDVDRLLDDLRVSASDHRDTRTEVSQLIADGINEFITDLEGIRSAADRGHYTPAVRAPEQQVRQTPIFGDAEFDNYVADIRQNADAQVAHDIVRISNIVADAMGTNVRGALENRPTEFAELLTAQAEVTQNAMLEEALRELADRIAPPVRDLNEQLPELNFEPDAGHPANAPQAQQPNVAPFRPIADDASEMTYDQLRNNLLPTELDDVSTLHDHLVRNNPDPDELRTIAQLVYDHQMSSWEHMDDTMRAMLYMDLLSTANRMEADLQRQAPVVAQQPQQLHTTLRAAADDALEQFESALDPEDSYSFTTEVARALDELRAGEDEVYGLWHEGGQMPPALREYFIRKLESMLDDTNDGNAEGGQIRGYQEGGKVEKYPPFYRASNQAITRAQEMHPNYAAQDNQTDAARHMLASGYMSQSFGPTIAKGLGYLHEFKEAPLRTAGHALGISKPRYDYEMDVHNNALGIELAQKAKNRAEFEKMVQNALRQSTTTTEPGRPRIMTPEQANEGRDALKYANGGTVSQSPSLDDMRFELQLRSK